jgi:catechol 2,3-dioxygenase-like lactoylglutathione lyase family enzyme
MKPDHITILVRSLAKSMPYYDALLPLLGYGKQKDHIWHDGDGFYLQFSQAKSDTADYARYAPGMNHLGFGAPDADFVRMVRETMASRGFAVPDIQDLGGATALFMKDPDGIRFEISHYPPGMAVVD